MERINRGWLAVRLSGDDGSDIGEQAIRDIDTLMNCRIFHA
jgi:hypothetical protein